MLYIKRVIDMLRTVLHDLSINICSRSCRNPSPDVLDVFTRISTSLDKLEADFSEFLDLYKEFNKNE